MGLTERRCENKAPGARRPSPSVTSFQWFRIASLEIKAFELFSNNSELREDAHYSLYSGGSYAHTVWLNWILKQGIWQMSLPEDRLPEPRLSFFSCFVVLLVSGGIEI